MFLYFVRHGESVNNSLGKWTGWADVPLTEKGEQDAKKARNILSGIAFDKVFSSDLCRAVKTANIALPDCDIEKTPEIREINLGDLTNKPISLNDEQRALIKKGGYSSFGGESRTEFRKRISKFLETVQTLECENVAAFAHGGVFGYGRWGVFLADHTGPVATAGVFWILERNLENFAFFIVSC